MFQSLTFLPCQPFALVPFPHPIFWHTYSNGLLSTPTPFHTRSSSHPDFTTFTPFHTRIFQRPYPSALSTVQAFILPPRQPP